MAKSIINISSPSSACRHLLPKGEETCGNLSLLKRLQWEGRAESLLPSCPLGEKVPVGRMREPHGTPFIG